MKVIDAFMFFNELDLLEIRLHEMDPIVDYFVIVESLERHGSNQPKDAVLRDNWNRFRQFERKIKYVLLPRLEPIFSGSLSGWEREYFNRNALLPPVLEVAEPDDAVIISDCDEIPRMTAIRDNLSELSQGVHRLSMPMYNYNVNRLITTDTPEGWDMAVIGTVRQIQQIGAQRARLFLRRDRLPPGWVEPQDSGLKTYTIFNAGWHFTDFFGSAEGVKEKLRSFSHASDPEEGDFVRKDARQILKQILEGVPVRSTRSTVWRETNDPTLPEYFLKNVDRFRHFTDGFFRESL